MQAGTHRKQADPYLPYNPAPPLFTCVFIGLSFDTPYLVELRPSHSPPQSVWNLRLCPVLEILSLPV